LLHGSSLTDSIRDILADYPSREVASKVTIHHLLTHTGGTGSIDRGPHRLELRTHADYIRLFSARDLLFEPGARYEYSNYGFILLGAVIEAVTEKSYHEAVDALVFQPAGMTATGSLPEEEHVADLSIGYTRSDRQSPCTPNTDLLPYRGDAAAGGYSTATDLLKLQKRCRSIGFSTPRTRDCSRPAQCHALGGSTDTGSLTPSREAFGGSAIRATLPAQTVRCRSGNRATPSSSSRTWTRRWRHGSPRLLAFACQRNDGRPSSVHQVFRVEYHTFTRARSSVG